VHLQDGAFDQDRQSLIEGAAQAGVSTFVCNGTHPDDWPGVTALAHSDPRVLACFGLHPWFVNQYKDTPWAQTLEKQLTDIPSGVGEIGLDRWIADHDLEAQVQAMRLQLTLARDLKRPAMIHCLKAWGHLMEELDRFGTFPEGLLIHGYGGPVELIQPLIKLNAWISFAGSVLHEQKARAREALVQVPLDRLLIESDAPDMPPPVALRCDPHVMTEQGRYRNTPANLPAILDGIAALRQENPTDLARAVNANCHHLLKGLL
jgi:TatD DNase family protein